MKKSIGVMVLVGLTAGMVLAQTNEEAVASFGSSLQIIGERSKDDRISFLIDIARSYLTETNTAAAINAFERVREIDPLHSEARLVLGTLYIEELKYKEAEAIFLGLIEDFPENFQVWNNLAWLYATASDMKIRNGVKAVRYAQEAMLLAPESHHVWSTLSEAYYISGDYEKAHRAALQMASLVVSTGVEITATAVEDYNRQLLKCQRALETAKALEELRGEAGPAAPSTPQKIPAAKPVK